MTEIQLSFSPRMTWLWAPDLDTAERVRRACNGAVASQRGEDMPLVTDIGIGVHAYVACEALAEQGFTFTWHESVHPLNRASGGWESSLPGMPDGESSAS